MKGIAIVAVALASLTPVALAQQTELGGKVRSGQTVDVPAGQTVQGDLLASPGTVRVDGRVDGDLVATGGRITVAGTVTGDLLAAGGNITVAGSGQVGGDARLAGGQVRMEGRVGEDLLVAAGQATVARGAQVGGDLIFAAGRMVRDGAVAGSVLGSTGNYTRAGSVGGSEKVTVRQPRRTPTLADRGFDALRRYLSIAIVGLLALWLVPRIFRGAGDAVRRRPLVAFGLGFVAAIGVVVAVVLVLFLTILLAIGLGLVGLGSLAGTIAVAGAVTVVVIVFLAFVAVMYGAQAAVGLGIGRLLVRGDRLSFGMAFIALLLGLLVVVLLAAIPVAGGWLEALLVLLGLGALLVGLFRRRREPAEPAEVAFP
jgi:cytoskeletal protein CcmA (bactofilin family)